MRSYLAILLITIFALLTSVPNLHAEPSFVKPDQYILTPVSPNARLAAADVSAGATALPDVQVLTQEAGQTIVRVPSNRGMRALDINSESYIPYNVRDNFCVQYRTELRAKHLACSPDYRVRATLTANDPYNIHLWGMPQIHAQEAWDVTTGSNDVVVAIIDTGINYNHTDLAANIWTNPGEIPGNGIDDDGNGYVDDVHGINTINNTGNPMDDHSHGTHCAGTIGAVGNNAVGVEGVAWRVKMIGVKFMTKSGSGSLSNAIKGLDYVTALKQRGVNVIATNNSWGGGGSSPGLLAAIERARAAGVIFVAAAGNEAANNDSDPHYPASYDSSNIVSVAAVDQNKNVAWFSNYGGTSVDVAAPGVGILSTYFKDNAYAFMSGTSMAAPHVTGVLALCASAAPGVTGAALIQRLYDNTSASDSLTGIVATGGIVNAYKCVVDAAHASPTPTPLPSDSPVATPTPTPSPTATATPTPTVTPKPKKKTERPTPTATPTRRPTRTPTMTPTRQPRRGDRKNNRG